MTTAARLINIVAGNEAELTDVEAFLSDLEKANVAPVRAAQSRAAK